MVTAWRLVKADYAGTAFDGEGARMYGGRWNPPGVAVVYLADSLALAALETFVHLSRAATSLRFVAFEVRIQDGLVERLDRRKLPSDWRTIPVPESTQKIGARWAVDRRSVALKVPSLVVPVENNYLLNPSHPDFRKVKIAKKIPFSFDPRMWK